MIKVLWLWEGSEIYYLLLLIAVSTPVGLPLEGRCKQALYFLYNLFLSVLACGVIVGEVKIILYFSSKTMSMMCTHKVLKVGEVEIKKIDNLFFYLGGLPTDIFKLKDWNVLYLESRPFIDCDSYNYFRAFVSFIKEKEINILNYPLVEGEEYLKFTEIPDFSDFDEMMDKFNFRYTGGVAFGDDLNWGIHSDPDNHILFLGYEKKFESKIKDIFSANKFIIDKEKLIDIYEKHKVFLKGRKA